MRTVFIDKLGKTGLDNKVGAVKCNDYFVVKIAKLIKNDLLKVQL